MMFDHLLMKTSQYENEKFRADQAEFERDKLLSALTESVKLLRSSLYIKPDNSAAFKAKIHSFEKIIQEASK